MQRGDEQVDVVARIADQSGPLLVAGQVGAAGRGQHEGRIGAARNLSYNASLPAGGSTNIGFQATHTGNIARPGSFTLNGTPCAASPDRPLSPVHH